MTIQKVKTVVSGVCNEVSDTLFETTGNRDYLFLIPYFKTSSRSNRNNSSIEQAMTICEPVRMHYLI